MENEFETEARRILERHGCKLISMISETKCVWENKIGIQRSDDVFVLRNMSEENFEYWANN